MIIYMSRKRSLKHNLARLLITTMAVPLTMPPCVYALARSLPKWLWIWPAHLFGPTRYKAHTAKRGFPSLFLLLKSCLNVKKKLSATEDSRSANSHQQPPDIEEKPVEAIQLLVSAHVILATLRDPWWEKSKIHQAEPKTHMFMSKWNACFKPPSLGIVCSAEIDN